MSECEKRQIADRLLKTPKPVNHQIKKPVFPTAILRNQNSSLASFVGADSWLLFTLLEAGDDWLDQPPVLWPASRHYREMHNVVSDLSVVNDTAERSIKDIQDYADSANDTDQRQNIILVSQSHRIKIPNYLENQMEEKL